MRESLVRAVTPEILSPQNDNQLMVRLQCDDLEDLWKSTDSCVSAQKSGRIFYISVLLVFLDFLPALKSAAGGGDRTFLAHA
jgi:hypothetical protein